MERIEKLKEFLQQAPDDSFLKYALALEYRKIGNDAEALAWFESVLEKDPAYVGTYYQVGKFWEEKGDTAKATDYYEKGLVAAKAANNRHAASELRAALDELTD